MRFTARPFGSLSGPVIVATAVGLSAWFAARVVTHVAEAAAFDDRRPAVTATPAPLAPPTATAAPLAPGDAAASGVALVQRNMFCSSCRPAGDGGDGGGAPAGPHAVPRLIATQVVRDGGWATLDDPARGIAGMFALGAALPGGGVIAAVERGAIIVRFADATTTRVALATDAGAGGAAGAGPPAKVAAASDAWADRVRATGDRRWEVDRTLIRELVQAGAGAGPAVKGVRLAPVAKDGKLAGVRVAQARDGSLARALGLEGGDVIESIDGRAIDSPAALMEVYGRLDDTRRVDLGIKRKGGAQTLTYDLP